MKKRLLIFALVLISVTAGTAIVFSADNKEYMSEQAAKPVQEEGQEVVMEDSVELKMEEAAIPANAEPIPTNVSNEIARGGIDVNREVSQQPVVETPAAPTVAVETPAPAPAVELPPAEEAIAVPDDWDAFINGDTAPVNEAV